MPSELQRNAYASLITRPSYLAGVVILAYTLKKTGSIFPLVVLYTDTLPASSVAVIAAEASSCNIVLKKTKILLPKDYDERHLIAERFADTWAKLRVFELFEFDLVCQLDADMIIRKDMDQIFSMAMPDDDWLVSTHACVCNVDKDPWAPVEWNQANCAHTPMQHPEALTKPTQPSMSTLPTHHMLNSGMFMFRPSQQLWDQMMTYFDTCPDLAKLQFPDQDFLGNFFRDRWSAAGWQYNALKTMRYLHPNIWRDDEVRCLHYIVDKPWAKRIGPDGIAGFRGLDGETHQWWWNEFETWKSQRERSNQTVLIQAVEKYVAKPLGIGADESEDLRAIGSQVQAFASRKTQPGIDGSASDLSRL
ncbi:MAG: hypothetical protein M1828_000402 [Chrysothrix sp. TS-e1954]|nr:MAG: hypothetical protein M1828_000402 [Chrysothrix sp. TS-e1954]